jgi:DNA-binding transcriptional ArsR family regulator
MPVKFDEYKKTQAESGELPIDPDSNAYKVLSFLAERPELGFKPSEILEHVDIPKGSLNPTLSRLEARGLVEHEAPYWSAGDDDRLTAITGDDVQYASVREAVWRRRFQRMARLRRGPS